MEHEPPSALLRALSPRFPQGLDASSVGREFVRVLLEIRGILPPILGARGVAALLQRSLHQARARFSWLADPFAEGDFIDLPALQSSFAGQDAASARAAAVDGVLASFETLLTSLIGESLTERLFDSVWTLAPEGGHVKETAP